MFPKKLSDVKVNPSIAASIQGFAGGTKQGGDLLSDEVTDGGTSQTKTQTEFDPFSNFAASGASQQDPFGTSTQQTVVAQTQQEYDPFGDMTVPTPQSAVQQTQSQDPFGTSVQQSPVPQTKQVYDPFGDIAGASAPTQPVQQNAIDLLDSLDVPTQNIANNGVSDPFQNMVNTTQNVNTQQADVFQNFSNAGIVTQNNGSDPFQNAVDPFGNGQFASVGVAQETNEEWVDAVHVGKKGGKVMTGQKGPAAQKAAAQHAKQKSDPFADLDILKN
eukprot:TRINITY_DN23921_c0_g1_i2.p1 TRINITY_DN23921_c0_g1~~TRINITY_DN23921_c0_g1_i2.p1  ORF type:complete len:274 (+),score=65.95 TRINITY_DN23921_c0_g1_i2:718-1539(+)